MRALFVAAALATTAFSPYAAVPAASASSASAIGTTFSIGLPLSAAPAAPGQLAAALAAQSATTIYIALQSAPGHGDAGFSYTEKVAAMSCSVAGGAENCTFGVAMPAGTDTFAILATDAANVPLAYTIATATIAVGASAVRAHLSPIIAKALPHYAFAPIAALENAPRPAISTMIFDADGNVLSLSAAAEAPFGNARPAITATQTGGQFTVAKVANLAGTGIVSTSAPMTTATIAPAPVRPFLIEVGDGSTAAFTATLTLSVPQVQFTQTEFPQLPSAALTVPASANSITLTCAFPVPAPAADPCAGTSAAVAVR